MSQPVPSSRAKASNVSYSSKSVNAKKSEKNTESKLFQHNTAHIDNNPAETSLFQTKGVEPGKMKDHPSSTGVHEEEKENGTKLKLSQPHVSHNSLLQSSCPNEEIECINNNLTKASENEPCFLTTDDIDARIDNILNEVDFYNPNPDPNFQQDYFGIDRTDDEDKNMVEENRIWPVYFYLRKCVLDHINQKNNDLKNLLKFLNGSHFKWFTDKLMDESIRIKSEYWGAGSHEWLLRSLIVGVLERSAGMVNNVEGFRIVSVRSGFPSQKIRIDWLHLQAFMRTRTSLIFFKNERNTIESGHTPAVKSIRTPKNKGMQTTKSPEFHDLLINAFNISKHLASFIIRTENILKKETITGKKPLCPTVKTLYLIDGTRTTKPSELSKIRKNTILKEYYKKTTKLFDDFITLSTNHGETRYEDLSVIGMASDITEHSDMTDPTSAIAEVANVTNQALIHPPAPVVQPQPPVQSSGNPFLDVINNMFQSGIC